MKLWKQSMINGLNYSPLGADRISLIVFSFLTCLLQPWSVCMEVVDPNAGGRHSLRHLILRRAIAKTSISCKSLPNIFAATVVKMQFNM